MPSPENIVRSKEIYKKRKSNPKVWTWGKLGELYNIHRSFAKQIFEREVRRHSEKSRQLVDKSVVRD